MCLDIIYSGIPPSHQYSLSTCSVPGHASRGAVIALSLIQGFGITLGNPSHWNHLLPDAVCVWSVSLHGRVHHEQGWLLPQQGQGVIQGGWLKRGAQSIHMVEALGVPGYLFRRWLSKG